LKKLDAKRKHAKTHLLELGAIENRSTEYQSAKKAFQLVSQKRLSPKIFDDSRTKHNEKD
jgi:hypothetical protein